MDSSIRDIAKAKTLSKKSIGNNKDALKDSITDLEKELLSLNNDKIKSIPQDGLNGLNAEDSKSIVAKGPLPAQPGGVNPHTKPRPGIGPLPAQPGGVNPHTKPRPGIGPLLPVDGGPKQSSEEDTINNFLRIRIAIAGGARFAENSKEAENFFKALSKATGVQDTSIAKQAINKFFVALEKDIKRNYNKDLDQNGDGKVDAKDLEKIFAETGPKPKPGGAF